MGVRLLGAWSVGRLGWAALVLSLASCSSDDQSTSASDDESSGTDRSDDDQPDASSDDANSQDEDDETNDDPPNDDDSEDDDDASDDDRDDDDGAPGSSNDDDADPDDADDDSADDSDDDTDDSSNGSADDDGSDEPDDSADDVAAGEGEVGVEPAPGRFGEPENTFTLPKPDGDLPALYHPELVSEFGDVDFATLDRLYLPAGEYRSVLLGGLPERSAERPLVITNIDGQVRVGGDAANYVFVISGGTNWVLTGRHDAASRTGDAAYPGHAGGNYARSQGTYGIFIDDAFSREGLSGLSIGGRASDFEIEMIEVTRAEFAGIVAKTDDDGSALMRNVSLHDTYVHDVGSEGIYFGSTQGQPQHAFENLRIYRNRFVRTGTEALQVGQLGDGAEIHHNVLGPAAIRWRSAFQRYQDGNVQYGQRYGSSHFHHNIVVGTGDLFVELFPQPVEGDEHGSDDRVLFSDNYFSDSSSSGVYTHADANAVSVVFERNSFRGFEFNYDEVYVDASLPVQVFGIGSNTENPHLLTNNVVDAPFPFVQWTFDSTTLEDNEERSIEALRFVDFINDEIEDNFRRLEWWTDKATLAEGEPDVTYAEGAYVMHLGKLYRAARENSGEPPDAFPDAWEELSAPADDVRLAADSPHADWGLGVAAE